LTYDDNIGLETPTLLTCTTTASTRVLARLASQGAAVNASDTQLNIKDGQEGGGGAMVPSHAKLPFVT
jgi:hypothetical protein